MISVTLKKEGIQQIRGFICDDNLKFLELFNDGLALDIPDYWTEFKNTHT